MKKNKRPLSTSEIVIWVFVIIGILLVVANIVALVKYGNTPVSELPTWAYWLMKAR